MSKSSKKRRQKRKKDLEKLRGMSVLDDECSPVKPLGSSPNPLTSTYLLGHSRATLPSDPDENDRTNEAGEANSMSTSDSILAQRRVIEFVFPRANGRTEQFVFNKQARERTIVLSSIPETRIGGQSEVEPKVKKEETLEDILFPTKRRRLEDKFEAVHRAEETKKGDDGEGDKTIIVETKVDTPSAPFKPKKKKKRRSTSLDKEVSNMDAAAINGPDDAIVETMYTTSTDMANRQLSGRSVEQAVEDKSGLRPRANSTDGELNLPQRGLCDEQMVLQSHKWQDKHTFAHQTTPRGLNNLGNTCFLSSILQCLAYSPPFCQSLIAISEMKDGQARNGMNPKQNQGQRITTILCHLFHRVHGFSGEYLNERSVSPQAIVQMLPKLGSIGSRNGYKFWPGRQEDAHEFLVHLLDAMHDGELRGAGINQHLSGWRDRLPVTRLDETTFIHRIFGGYFRSQVRCKACGYCSNTYDPFLDLSLEVSNKSSSSIMYALGEFTRKETLDSENQWKCSGCKKYVCPTKQLTVFRAPLCLCIQLKRFAFDIGFGGSNGRSSFGSCGSFSGRSKIAKPIEFPADLSLPLSDGRSCAYSLTGVVIHVGGNASSGHYTAYVKKPGKQGKSQWYHADDSFVEPVSEKTVLRQKDAYILFYCRKEVKLEFPSLPPRDMSTEEAKEFGRARARARADSSGAEESGLGPNVESTDIPSSPQTSSIHPLAAFLNKSMSEQFKGMSPSKDSTQASEHISPSWKAEVFDGEVRDNSSDSDSSASKVETSKTQKEPRKVETSSVGDDLRDTKPEKIESKVNLPVKVMREYVGKYSRAESSSEGASPAESEGSSSVDETASRLSASSHLFPSNGTSIAPGNSSLIKPTEVESDSETEVAMESASFARNPSTTTGKGDPRVASSSSSASESSASEPVKMVSTTESAAVGPPRNIAATELEGGAKKTRVVVGSTDSRAKVKVMMGPRSRKAWVSKTFATTQKGSEFQLLGNLSVSTWEEKEDTETRPESKPKPESYSRIDSAREAIVQTMEKEEKSKKRKMHLDRWDSVLDLGRTKKVKKNADNASTFNSENPKKNAFQRIQAGIQQMNKGKAKGLFRRKPNDGTGQKKKNGRP